MNRRIVLSCLSALFCALVAIAAMPSSGAASGATAPLAACCSYKIDISCTLPIPSGCFPITVKTNWAGGLTWSSTHTLCGVYTVTPSSPPFPPCPPGLPAFQFLTINGSPTIVVLNQPVRVIIGACCYLVSASLDGAGCLYVKIQRC